MIQTVSQTKKIIDMGKVSTDPSILSDNALIDLCREYGKNAKLWLRKFAILLPEVYKRHLYKKKGFCSIHEFAAKVAGMNHETTDRILSLSRVLEDKPVLKSLIEHYGWSKIRVVANIATKETDEFWAEKVKILSKNVLEVYVRKLKEKEIYADKIVKNIEMPETLSRNIQQSLICNPVPGDGSSGLENAKSQINSTLEMPVGNEIRGGNHKESEQLTTSANFKTFSIKLDPETEFRLRLLKQKIEKEKKEPISFNQLFKEMLNMIDGEKSKCENKGESRPLKKCFAKPKSEEKKGEDGQNAISLELMERRIDRSSTIRSAKTSRYIPSSIKKQLQQKYQSHCAFPGCTKPAENIHHIQRYATYKNMESESQMPEAHAPQNLIPLCKTHHAFEHETSEVRQENRESRIVDAYYRKIKFSAAGSG